MRHNLTYIKEDITMAFSTSPYLSLLNRDSRAKQGPSIDGHKWSIDEPDKCPVCGQQMVTALAGPRKIPVFVCEKSRVCLPQPTK